MKEKFSPVKIIKDSEDNMGKEISSKLCAICLIFMNKILQKSKNSMLMRTGFTSLALNSQKCVIGKHYQNQPWVCLM